MFSNDKHWDTATWGLVARKFTRSAVCCNCGGRCSVSRYQTSGERNNYGRFGTKPSIPV